MPNKDVVNLEVKYGKWTILYEMELGNHSHMKQNWASPEYRKRLMDSLKSSELEQG